MSDLPLAAISRIAKNNGAERIGNDAVVLLVDLAEGYVAKISADAAVLADHAGRKTVKAEDVELAARNIGVAVSKPTPAVVQ